jgi:hypothetical protein
MLQKNIDVSLTNDTKLNDLEIDILRSSRRLGVIGFIILLVGGTGTIASSNEVEWVGIKLMYLLLVLIGALALTVAQHFIRILMKHSLKHFSIFPGG